jgi:ribosomal 50S subunit-recycling heat shock protein
MEKKTKIQFNEVKIGDIVTVRYADETCSCQVFKIEDQFQKNGIKQIILYREDGRMIWVAKETTKIFRNN